MAMSFRAALKEKRAHEEMLEDQWKKMKYADAYQRLCDCGYVQSLTLIGLLCVVAYAVYGCAEHANCVQAAWKNKHLGEDSTAMGEKSLDLGDLDCGMGAVMEVFKDLYVKLVVNDENACRYYGVDKIGAKQVVQR